MSPQSYESLAAYILTVDKSVLAFLLPLDFMLALAVVALFVRHRRPLEMFALLMFAWTAIFTLSALVFHLLLQRPFLRLEIVQFPSLFEFSTLLAPFFS